jgi:putative acetyltransferase
MLGVSNAIVSAFHASRPSVRLDAMMLIRQALFPTEQDDVVSIFREYVTSPTANLDFQEYEAEFAGLHGQYAAPTGRLLLSRENDTVLGCAALRRVDESTCEMKRVYVRPAARGKGLGRRLVEAILSEAKLAGYSRLCLDVLSTRATVLLNH